jgi:hypothetical protein
MTNYINGTWGKAQVATGLAKQDITIEEAAEALTGSQGHQIGGFWDTKADRDCRDGKPMTDIDPALFPKSRGPRG